MALPFLFFFYNTELQIAASISGVDTIEILEIYEKYLIFSY